MSISAQTKLAAVNGVLVKKESVTSVAKKFSVPRRSLYRWLRLYKDAPLKSKKSCLAPKYVSGAKHSRAIYPRIEEKLLALVAKRPELSVHRLINFVPASSWTVWKILDRNNLNFYQQRLVYSEKVAASRKPALLVKLLDRVRLVWEEFIPSLAPAPPPEIHQQILNVLKAFSASVIVSFLFGFGTLYWIRLLGGTSSFGSAIGIILATIALGMGSIFFLYSLKYYLTLAIVLSFSQQEATSDKLQLTSNKKKGLLSWLLGLSPSQRFSEPAAGPMGLTPNLEHVVLKRHPFISVHIPLYNEKNVVERVIAATTNFQYQGSYEVILCDDSTDETTEIIRDYFRKLKTPNSKLQIKKGEGWELTQVEVRDGVTLKHLHRTTREGFKGGALREALRANSPKAEFVVVFDADFVPYPDTLELFLKYFQVTAGTLDFRSRNPKSQILNPKQSQNSKQFRASDFVLSASRSKIAAVQGYQWHVLNKSENWITRAVRAEYAGSYVIERSGTEIYSGLKQISGAVYMIRRDVLEEIGWETSITEDFQLTLKLYEKGYKVVYTPYIQAPAECVSTIKRLIRQRMRWAEGHSNNIRRMFTRLMFGKRQEVNGKSEFVPSPLSISEKLEFLYLSPYYLQAFFFLIGTFSWLISETVFRARLPFWTSLWGWSLVLTNLLALPLMNAVGLFLEESDERDYQGLLSFIALSYILVPFQAYAAIKGFLEREEGPWFRTPKTGRITDIFTRGRFYRFIAGILPGRSAPAPISADASRLAPISASISSTISENQYVALATANNTSTPLSAFGTSARLSAFSRFNSFSIKTRKGSRWLGKLALAFVLSLSLLAHSMAFNAQPVEATWMNTNWQYRKTHTINSATGAGTNYQVRVTVYYGAGTDSGENVYLNSKSRTDFGDIRFTDDDKVTLLDYWLESKVDSNNAVFWVEVADDLSSTNRDIYIYYGNSSATTTSNGVNTFLLYDDDFASGWTDQSGTIAVESGEKSLYRSGLYYGATTKAGDTGWTDYSIEARGKKLEDLGSSEFSIVGRYNGTVSSTYGDPVSAVKLTFYESYIYVNWRKVEGSWTQIGTNYNFTVPVGTWYTMRLDMVGSSFKAYKDGTEIISGTDSNAPTSGQIALLVHQSHAHFDNVRVRKLASPEPSHGAWGSEEEVAELVLLLAPLALMLPMIVQRLRRRFSFSQVGRA